MAESHKKASDAVTNIMKKTRLPTAIATAIIFVLVLVIIVLSVQQPTCASSTSSFASIALQPDNTKYRLPRNVLPTNYKIHFTPDETTKRLNGTVHISLIGVQKTKEIVLHGGNLTVASVYIINGVRNANWISEKREEIKRVIIEEKSEFIRLHLDDTIEVNGRYVLEIKYSTSMDRGLVGPYMSQIKGTNRTVVSSKFQPTYARRAFPCFDEPEYKATYDITIVKPMGHIALSNMNEVSKTLEADKKEAVTFATSVPMSTYLACFVICEFDFKETDVHANGQGDDFKLRTYAQKENLHKVDFALDIGKRATEFYIRYYDVPYPLPKLDMIGIPDYQSGATEHWGLITYRETSFLYDPKTSSSRNKLNIAGTIAHELAHMWFGNLVTLKWWDDIWLNEGFATYMQHKALNAVEPTWDMYDHFVSKTFQHVLVLDSKLSSHPIVQTAESPDQITALFDAIAYNKGASILRMIEGFIGEENFRLGISDYLKKYKFSNAVTQQLLTELERYFSTNSGLNLTHIVDTWTRQMGYPLVTVTEVTPGHYRVSQSRFLQDPDAIYNVADSPFKYRWCVPITYYTNLNQKSMWLTDKDSFVDIKLNGEEKLLKLNVRSVGYYRVNYPTHMWESLIDLLKTDVEFLSASDRANLLDDVFALADSRHVPYDLALKLTTYLSNETHYAPWHTAHNIYHNLQDRLQSSIAKDNLKEYFRNLIDPIYADLTVVNGSKTLSQRLLRSKILGLATAIGYSKAESTTQRLFNDWLNSYSADNSTFATTIEPDLRDFVYYYGLKYCTLREWQSMWKLYLKETDPAEQNKMRSALAAPRDTTILKRYLELAWDEKNVRSQDYFNVLSAIANNPSGTGLVWDHVRSNWPELVNRFSLNNRYLGSVIPSITDTFSTKLKLQEVESFFAEFPEAGAGTAARQRALETVKNNIIWVQFHEKNVANWIEKQIRAEK